MPIKKTFTIGKEKGGIALILSFLVLSSLMAISLAVASLSIQQSRLSRQAEESVGAYQAADTGIEYFLFLANKMGVKTRQDLYDETGLVADEQFCSGSSVYWFEVNWYYGSYFCLEPTVVSDVDDTITNIKVIGRYGRYGDTRRAIELMP